MSRPSFHPVLAVDATIENSLLISLRAGLAVVAATLSDIGSSISYAFAAPALIRMMSPSSTT
jgi:hypothetical protein